VSLNPLDAINFVNNIVDRVLPDATKAAEIKGALTIAINSGLSRWTPQAILALAVGGETLWRLHEIDSGGVLIWPTMAIRLGLLTVLLGLDPGKLKKAWEVMEKMRKKP
jgi:hypothetical protein